MLHTDTGGRHFQFFPVHFGSIFCTRSYSPSLFITLGVTVVALPLDFYAINPLAIVVSANQEFDFIISSF